MSDGVAGAYGPLFARSAYGFRRACRSAAMRAGGSTNRNTTTLHLALASTAVHRVPLAAGDELAPGDKMVRTLELRGAVAKGTVTMRVVPASGDSSLLDTDRRNGLQLTVAQCIGAHARLVQTATTVKCVRGHVRTLATVPVADAERHAIVLAKAALAPSMHLRLQLAFPRSAGNRFQDLSSSFDIRFTVRVRK